MSGRYNWVHFNGGKLRDVGILADGTLYNPNGYPEQDVRDAVLAADERRHARRSKSAKKAAQTRKTRRDKNVYAVAQHLALNGKPIGPRTRCVVCERFLTDPPSIARGIGSECWQDVLHVIESLQPTSGAS